MLRKSLFSLFMTAAIAGPALADNWSMNLSSCAPSDSTLRQDKYKTDTGHVRFRGTNTGTLIFRCPVAAAALPVSNLQLVLYARDDDGNKGRVKVEARLKMQSVTNGAASEGLLASVTTAPANDPGELTHVSGFFDHTFEFDKKQYYVEVRIFRDKPTVEAVAFGVAVRLGVI